MVKKISRYGSYGIVTQNGALLLTPKNSGPYLGLWDLPGGGIEFGESPEQTLHRELAEETALRADALELLNVFSKETHYMAATGAADFHHIGVLYRVHGITVIEHLEPEAKPRWAQLSELSTHELTPFAQIALELLSTNNKEDSVEGNFFP